jgi:hypothetical protein
MVLEQALKGLDARGAAWRGGDSRAEHREEGKKQEMVHLTRLEL